MHRSVSEMWNQFIATTNLKLNELPEVWHFCDNEQDANICAELVKQGKKRATAPSLWYFECQNEQLPKVGDLDIVTDWAGVAQCIIRTTKVSVIPYDEITDWHAQAEGEGDGTLAWWRQAHWDYYKRELENTDFEPQLDMPLVFREFECVWPSALSKG